MVLHMIRLQDFQTSSKWPEPHYKHSCTEVILILSARTDIVQQVADCRYLTSCDI